ncbi:MAG TPA: ABC transporter substrate-binding protein [Anaerolineae bacterium]|nr:ABC transporter substrate-binding protein [Anaerolineae bacterium]
MMDDLNPLHEMPVLAQAPRKIVSLVPSLTESLFDLGAGDRLVGITDYCTPPEADRARLQRLGGTKSPDVEAILDLKPDLILANREENVPETIHALEAAGLRVWLTFPQSVEQAMDVLWGLVNLLRIPEAAARLQSLQISLEWTAKAIQPDDMPKVFCPIWQEQHDQAGMWWMTFNRQTYCHDVLARCGGENVFAERQRRYPLEADLGLTAASSEAVGDTRYPRVTASEILDAAPEIIFLPSEPFAFSEQDADQIQRTFAETPAVRSGRVHRIDGTLITWHGTRLARALTELPAYLQQQAPQTDGFR